MSLTPNEIKEKGLKKIESTKDFFKWAFAKFHIWSAIAIIYFLVDMIFTDTLYFILAYISGLTVLYLIGRSNIKFTHLLGYLVGYAVLFTAYDFYLLPSWMNSQILFYMHLKSFLVFSILGLIYRYWQAFKISALYTDTNNKIYVEIVSHGQNI